MKNLFYLIFVVCLLVGCKSTECIPVYHTRDSVEYREIRDSIYIRDSVYVNRWKSGDTVFIDREIVRYLYRDRFRTDTVRYRVREPYPVEKPVEVNVLYWWQKCLMWVGVAALLFIIVWIARALKRT